MAKTRVDISNAPFLNVPIEDKERAKLLGARWHAGVHRWFIPKGKNQTLFADWIPVVEMSPSLRARAPFYVVESLERCWKCGSSAPVVTLASEGIDPSETEASNEFDDDEDEDLAEPINDFVVYSYIEYVPERLAAFLRRRYNSYYVDYSKTTDCYYWMNHCSCGAPLGDFYMHDEPDGAFFPTDEGHATAIRLLQIKATGHVALRAVFGCGAGDMMQEFSSREVYEPQPGVAGDASPHGGSRP